MQDNLSGHLQSGSTTVCRAWKVERKDGETLGFTDHDGDLIFDGVKFMAQTGLTARALQQTSGFAVDNTEAMGALSDASVREEDILAGRYDGAGVTAYLVNWQQVDERTILFRGTFGEIVRSEGMFQVELRGLTERLNGPVGQVFHAECSALLGDRRCTVDLASAAVSVSAPVMERGDGRVFRLGALPQYQDGWFAHGRLIVVDGEGEGQIGIVKSDKITGDLRVIELWQPLTIQPQPGDVVRLEAGCDKRSKTCREKFGNFLNFRGFPHIPGEDWLRSYPSAANAG